MGKKLFCTCCPPALRKVDVESREGCFDLASAHRDPVRKILKAACCIRHDPAMHWVQSREENIISLRLWKIGQKGTIQKIAFTRWMHAMESRQDSLFEITRVGTRKIHGLRFEIFGLRYHEQITCYRSDTNGCWVMVMLTFVRIRSTLVGAMEFCR